MHRRRAHRGLRRHPPRTRPIARQEPARRGSGAARRIRGRAQTLSRRRRARDPTGAAADGRADERPGRRGGAVSDADAEGVGVPRADRRVRDTPTEDNGV